MKRLIALLAVTSAVAVAACEGPQSNEPEYADTPMEVPIAPAAEDVGEPVAAPGAINTPPADSTTLPPEKRSSAESVQPDSETLFY